MKYNPEIVFTFPAVMGGVASFNFNIINHSSLRPNFRTKVILLKAKEDDRPAFTEKFQVDESITFQYSHKENQYCVLKRLEKLIGKAEGAVVCDNALTIQACNLFHNPKTIFHLLHDYFYVSQNIGFGTAIDAAVAHSSFFSDCVFAASPTTFAHRTFYIPYGVKQYDEMPIKNKGLPLKLFFLGRLDDGKGVDNLIKIEEQLQIASIEVSWTLIGKGPLKEMLLKQWTAKKNIIFIEPDTTKEVYDILSTQDLFIFPTQFEGTPVSVMEAMSNGCATIVSDLPGGIRDLVSEDTGFKVPVNDMAVFAEKIKLLSNDRSKLMTMQEHAWYKSKNQYDVVTNSDNYFKLFLEYEKLKRDGKNKIKLNLSRLDKPYIPNVFVKFIRNLRT